MMISAKNDEMMKNDKKWHYLAVKKLSALLRGITSKHVRVFNSLNCFHSYSMKKNLRSMKKYVKIMIIAMQKCLMKTIKY